MSDLREEKSARMNKVLKHFFLLKSFIILTWKHQEEYRKEFFIAVADFCVITLLSMLFWQSIFGYIKVLGDWKLYELIVLSIFGSVSWTIGNFFAGFLFIPLKVAKGDIDKYLSRPVNPLFALLAEEMQLDEVLKGIITGGILLVVTLSTFGISVSISNLILSLGLLLVGSFVISMIKGVVSLLCFWVGTASFLNTILFLEDYGLERYPVDVLPIRVASFFTYIIPIGILSTFPARILFGKESNVSIIVLIAIALMVFWVFLLSQMWRRGVKRYDSAGG
jgi:ABC-2 type transport system permease protein